MRILHLVGMKKVPIDPDREAASGVVRAALELAKVQAAQGHEVWLATVGSRAWEAEWRGVRLVGLPATTWARRVVKGGSFHVHLPFVWLTLRHRFDVVHAHLYSYTRFLRARARIVHFHSEPSNGDIDSRGMARVLADSDAQIAVSEYVAERFRARTGSANGVVTVHNGANAAALDRDACTLWRTQFREALGIGTDEVAFLYAGAMVPEKGVVHLARAFHEVAQAQPSSHLMLAGSADLWGGNIDHVAGDDSYLGTVRGVLDGVPERQVHFLGKLGPDGMTRAYAACDAVVIPSVWQEPFPLVALEALAFGKPVIASAVGGLPEVISEVNGHLVPAGDEVALAEKMRNTANELLSDPVDSDRIRGSVAHLTWPAAAAKLDAVYRQVLGD